MSCQEFDIRDYFFGELPAAQRAAADRHVMGCVACSLELEQLKGVRGALLAVADEEPPRRIGFVSDKIFEPSPFRRWLSQFWLSGARLGFASAAMLSVALVVFAFAQQPRVIERRVEVAQAAPQPVQQVNVDEVVAKAVRVALAEQEKKTRQLLEASDRKHSEQTRAMTVMFSDYTENLEKRMAAQRSQMYAMDFPKGAQQ